MDEGRDTGCEIDPSQLGAMALLARGLHPCIVQLNEHGREVDKWGRVVERRSDERKQPPS